MVGPDLKRMQSIFAELANFPNRRLHRRALRWVKDDRRVFQLIKVGFLKVRIWGDRSRRALKRSPYVAVYPSPVSPEGDEISERRGACLELYVIAWHSGILRPPS